MATLLTNVMLGQTQAGLSSRRQQERLARGLTYSLRTVMYHFFAKIPPAKVAMKPLVPSLSDEYASVFGIKRVATRKGVMPLAAGLNDTENLPVTSTIYASVNPSLMIIKKH